jgi:hypothetical protein
MPSKRKPEPAAAATAAGADAAAAAPAAAVDASNEAADAKRTQRDVDRAHDVVAAPAAPDVPILSVAGLAFVSGSGEAVPADAQLPTPSAYLQGGSATSQLPMSNAAPAGEAANGANQHTDNKQFLSSYVCDGMESRVARVCLCVHACACVCVRW